MYFRLDNGIYMVGGGSGGPGISNFKDCNIYLVEGENDAFLIDAGGGLDSPLLLANIMETGCELKKIKAVLMTHAHGDHAGGLLDIKEAMPWVRVYSSAGEKSLIETGTEEQLGLVGAKRKGNYPKDYEFKHCTVDEVVVDDEKLHYADSEITCILLPGHSIESVCYLLDKNGRKYLFSGDSIYLDGKLSLINCYGSTMEGYRNNIHKLAGRNIDALLPGHFRLTMTGGQKHIDKAIEQLSFSSLPPMM